MSMQVVSTLGLVTPVVGQHRPLLTSWQRSAGKCHWLNLHHPWEHQLAASECWHPTWHWHDKWHGPRYPTPATSCTESIDPEYLKPEIHPNGQRCDASRATFS